MENSFFSHPFWPLLIFGFLVCPRILLITLWYPIRAKIHDVISYPVLSLIGLVIAPRFTLACIFAGFYWNTDKELAIAAFVLSIGAESFEKLGMKKFFKLFAGWFIIRKICMRIKDKREQRRQN